MSNRKLFESSLACLAIIGMLLSTGEGHAATATANGCDLSNFLDGYYFPGGRKSFDDERYVAHAPRRNVPVFSEASGMRRSERALKFGERVRIVDPGEGVDRMKVSDGKGNTIGWVSRNELTCNVLPLSVMMRVIAGGGAGQPTSATRRIFETPEPLAAEQPCGVGQCPEVRVGRSYFIYDERQDHYLIAEFSNLGTKDSRLLGWLPKSEGYLWDTGIGLRPKEDVKSICAYATMGDLLNSTNCINIEGGHRWFGLSIRPAVIGKTARAYEVVFPSAVTDEASRSLKGATHAFVPIEEKVVPEVLLSREQLDRLLKVSDVPRSSPTRELRYSIASLRLKLPVLDLICGEMHRTMTSHAAS